MKKLIVAISFALTALLFAGPVFAAGNEGLGVFIGASDSTISPSMGSEIDVSGSTFGVDYQFPLGESLSFNPFYLVSSEDGDDPNPGPPPVPIDVDVSVLGVQLRYWFDGVFLGAHAGRYKAEIKSGTVDQSITDTGYGAIIGWEGEGGLFLSAQYDTVTFDFPAVPGGPGPQEIEVTSIRALIGYRF